MPFLAKGPYAIVPEIQLKGRILLKLICKWKSGDSPSAFFGSALEMQSITSGPSPII